MKKITREELKKLYEGLNPWEAKNRAERLKSDRSIYELYMLIRKMWLRAYRLGQERVKADYEKEHEKKRLRVLKMFR